MHSLIVVGEIVGIILLSIPLGILNWMMYRHIDNQYDTLLPDEVVIGYVRRCCISSNFSFMDRFYVIQVYVSSVSHHSVGIT